MSISFQQFPDHSGFLAGQVVGIIGSRIEIQRILSMAVVVPGLRHFCKNKNFRQVDFDHERTRGFSSV